MEDEGETLYIYSVPKENEYKQKVMTHTKIHTHSKHTLSVEKYIKERDMFMIERLHFDICIEKHLHALHANYPLKVA